MKKQTLFLLACIALMLTSCSTMRKSTASSTTVQSQIYQYPTVADLDVKEKVEKQVSWPYKFIKWGEPSLEVRQANLMADILKENNADVLLEPQVTFMKRPFGNCFRRGVSQGRFAPSEHGANADAESQAMQPLARDAYKRRRTGVVGGEAHTEILGGEIGGR